MRYLLIFTLMNVVFSFNACSNADAVTEAEAFQKMMAVHDEIMPKMGEINRLSRELKALEAAIDTSNRELMGEIDGAIRALEKADQGMMAWMNLNGGNKLAKLQDEKSHEDIMAYITAEEKNILQVKADMIASIEQATTTLVKVQ